MKPFRWVLLLFLLACCSTQPLYAQQQKWFTGWWLYDNLVPDTTKGQQIESDLQVTNVANDNTFTAVQKFYCVNDTAAQLQLACSGAFSGGDILFQKGATLYRREPPGVAIWNAYAGYSVKKSYFSISHHKLVLHVEVQSAEDNSVKQFAYYRDLLPLSFSLRWQLERRYGSPQLLDDDDTVKIAAPGVDDDVPDSLSYTTVLPGEISSRENSLVKTLQVTSPDIQVVLLDDAEIDGDIISLYHNNQLVLDHKTLGKEVVKYTLRADQLHPRHEFVLVAENLGSIPPNTALLRIRAGSSKYEFKVHANLHQNVKFVVNYTGP